MTRHGPLSLWACEPPLELGPALEAQRVKDSAVGKACTRLDSGATVSHMHIRCQGNGPKDQLHAHVRAAIPETGRPWASSRPAPCQHQSIPSAGRGSPLSKGVLHTLHSRLAPGERRGRHGSHVVHRQTGVAGGPWMLKLCPRVRARPLLPH